MRRTTRAVVAGAVASVLLSGCWQQVGFNAGHTRHNDVEDGLTDDNVASLEEAWSVELPGATASEPMVRGGRVFVTAGGVEADGTRAARAAAYSARTGDQAWLRTFQTLTSGSADYVPGSLVGEELWTGYVVISTIGTRPIGDFGAPTRVDVADGTVVSKGESNIVSTSTAVTTGDRLVQTSYGFASLDRRIVVRDKATLATVWTGALPGGPPTGPVKADPAVADGQVFVPEATSLFAYDLAGCGAPTCAATWSLDLGSEITNVAAAPGGDTVFALSATELVAVDRATGAIAWRSATLPAAAPGLAILGDTIYIAADTMLATFSTEGCGATTCIPATAAPLKGAATAAPTIAGGVVYVGEPDLVEAFSTSLDPLAKVRVPGTANEMSVAGGRLFVVSRAGTANSQLTAFAPG